MHITNIFEAKANLSRLVELVQNSDETVIIGRAGKPVAVLSAFKESLSPRRLGPVHFGEATPRDPGSDHEQIRRARD